MIFGARSRATAGRADTVDLFFGDTLLQVTIYGPVWEGRSTATELRAMDRVFGGCFGVYAGQIRAEMRMLKFNFTPSYTLGRRRWGKYTLALIWRKRQNPGLGEFS